MAALSAQISEQIREQFAPHFDSLFKSSEAQQVMAVWAAELTAPLSAQLAELGDELMKPMRNPSDLRCAAGSSGSSGHTRRVLRQG